MNSKKEGILKGIQLFLYISFIFLWFKDNFYFLKEIRLSYTLPLIPLLGIFLVQLFFKIKQKKPKYHLKFNRTILAFLVIIGMAILLRIPFLFSSFGMMNSDNAIPALMAKHISEGKVPPICYYGQFYLGSLSSHFFAMVFKLFGYSIFTLKLSTLCIYLAFISVQFFFLKEIFSLTFSLILSFLYALPIGHLVKVSFDNTWPFSLVLLLGTSLLYLSYWISFKNKQKFYPLIGFLMGLSFWAHQISVCFILTALLIVAFKARPCLKNCARLFFFILVGGLPLLMQEIFLKFQIVNYLSAGARGLFSLKNLKTTAEFIRALLSRSTHASSYFLVFFVFLGMGILIFWIFKKKELSPPSIFVIFFIVFCMIYLFSRFSRADVIRYTYPLYFCLPVFLLSPFLLLRSRIKYLLSLGLVLTLFFVYNLKGYLSYYKEIQETHVYFKKVMAALDGIGEKFWLGDYWSAYLLTALTKERFIVDSITTNRYFPYNLVYYNSNGHRTDNFIFFRDFISEGQTISKNLVPLLDRCGINFKKNIINGCWLIYDIKSPVFPGAFEQDPPSLIPHLALTKTKSQEGYLYLTFQNLETRAREAFRINVEIPGFCFVKKKFFGREQNVVLRVPLPKEKTFQIRYYLDFNALQIPSSSCQLLYSCPDEEWNKRQEGIVYLSGFSQRIFSPGRIVNICEKKAELEINTVQGKKSGVRLVLNSPFQFSHFFWYGDYSQKVKISINNRALMERKLKDGLNFIEFELNGSGSKGTTFILTLDFKYHCFFRQFGYRKVAAILENVELK